MLEIWLPKRSVEEAMQSYNYREAIPNIFNSNLAYLPTTYALFLIKVSPLKTA